MILAVPHRRAPVPLLRSGPAPPGRGQATVLVVGALVLAAVVVVGVVELGRGVRDAATARTAADAAALAGAAEGRGAAERLATANAAVLVSYAAEGESVVVAVRVGRAHATARAERAGTWCGVDPGPQGTISYTDPPCPSTPG